MHENEPWVGTHGSDKKGDINFSPLIMLRKGYTSPESAVSMVDEKPATSAVINKLRGKSRGYFTSIRDSVGSGFVEEGAKPFRSLVDLDGSNVKLAGSSLLGLAAAGTVGGLTLRSVLGSRVANVDQPSNPLAAGTDSADPFGAELDLRYNALGDLPVVSGSEWAEIYERICATESWVTADTRHGFDKVRFHGVVVRDDPDGFLDVLRGLGFHAIDNYVDIEDEGLSEWFQLYANHEPYGIIVERKQGYVLKFAVPCGDSLICGTSRKALEALGDW